MSINNPTLETAVFGGGCFWCQEAVFELVPGVISVENGYAGGRRPNPSYEQVCSGATGHIEVVRLQFDPQRVSFRELLRVFFASHDPTTMDRQGADAGSQYRSVVFWADDAQKAVLKNAMAEIETKQAIKIVTESRALADNPFWKAEEYHQHYFVQHPEQAYCRVVIRPKVAHYLADPVK